MPLSSDIDVCVCVSSFDHTSAVSDAFNQIKRQWTLFKSALDPLDEDIKHVEARCGASVAAYFKFNRSVICGCLYCHCGCLSFVAGVILAPTLYFCMSFFGVFRCMFHSL